MIPQSAYLRALIYLGSLVGACVLLAVAELAMTPPAVDDDDAERLVDDDAGAQLRGDVDGLEHTGDVVDLPVPAPPPADGPA